MQKFFIIFRLTFIIATILYLTSCSSSTYSEKTSNRNQKINRPSDLPVITLDTEEDKLPDVPYDNLEAEQKSIVDRIYSEVKSNYKKEKFMQEIISFLNTPYKYGGASRNGIDCSAFTQQVYYKSLKVEIPRTAREQYKINRIFKDRDLLKFGDLIYFNTSDIYFPGHVGIYLDRDLFAHASSSNGVIISSLNNLYYSSKFVGANRVKVKK